MSDIEQLYERYARYKQLTIGAEPLQEIVVNM